MVDPGDAFGLGSRQQPIEMQPTMLLNLRLTQSILVCCIALFIGSCKQPAVEPHYMQLLYFGTADSITAYNKGVGLYGTLRMDLTNDSVVYQTILDLTGSRLHTYAWKVNQLIENDTVADAIKVIKELPDHIRYDNLIPDGVGYCWPKVYLEYVQGGRTKRLFLNGVHGQKLGALYHYYMELDERLPNLEKAPRRAINKDSIVVTALKNLGIYDSVGVRRNAYVPLSCDKGIEFEKLVGSWRSISDEYNAAAFEYWIHKIDSAGNWTVYRVDCNDTTLRYSRRVKTINRKKFLIELTREDGPGPGLLEVLTLTDNCFEFRTGDQLWRLNRVQ